MCITKIYIVFKDVDFYHRPSRLGSIFTINSYHINNLTIANDLNYALYY